MLKHEVYRNNPRTEDDPRNGVQNFTSSSTYNDIFVTFLCVSAIKMTTSSTCFKWAMQNIELKVLGPNQRICGSAALSYL